MDAQQLATVLAGATRRSDRGGAAGRSGLSRENSIYRRTMAVCDELAAAALGGADPVRLTEVFARLVGKRIVLLDTGFRLRAQAGGAGSLRGDAQDARRKARSLGLRDDAVMRVAMLRPAPSEPDWAQRIVSILPGAAAAQRDGALVMIVPGDPSVIASRRCAGWARAPPAG